MNRIQRITGNTAHLVTKAIDNTLCIIDIDNTYRIESYTKMTAGRILVTEIFTGEQHLMTIWKTESGDVLATPDWMLDWMPGEWSGVSALGVDFTIGEDGDPTLEA